MPHPPPGNTEHAKAANIYDTNAQELTMDQRELEGKILLKSNMRIQKLINDWDNISDDILEETLKYNRKIWMIFYDTARENKENAHTDELRKNITNLADFIFKRELDILSAPEKHKLDILININKQIADGLMASNT